MVSNESWLPAFMNFVVPSHTGHVTYLVPWDMSNCDTNRRLISTNAFRIYLLGSKRTQVFMDLGFTMLMVKLFEVVPLSLNFFLYNKVNLSFSLV